MLSGIPLFPDQASTLAPQVDNLYFFLLMVTGFFAILVVILVLYFAVRYRDDTGQKVGSPITGSVPLEIGWSLIPFMISMAIFVYATVVYFNIVRPPAETLEIYSTGKRWMWRFQHIDGQSEINDLHVPTRPCRARDVHLRGRAAQPVHPGLPGEGRCDSRPVQLDLVHADADRHVPPVLRRVLRHEALRDDRHRDRHGAERLPGVAERQRRPADGGARRAVVPAARVRQLSPDRRLGPRSVARRDVRRAGAADQRHDRRCRRLVHPGVDPDAAHPADGRLPGDDADLPGPIERGRRDEPHRIHQDAAARAAPVASRHRRPCQPRPQGE